MKHYIAMAGLHGFLPQICEVYSSRQDAIDSMADLHELTPAQKEQLKKQSYLELNLDTDGNEYIEIQTCYCKNENMHIGG